jgi:hypothetical protein
VLTTPHRKKLIMLRIMFRGLGIGLILRYDPCNGKEAYRALVGKPEVRRQLERPRRRWEDNIKMDLREAGWGAQTVLIWLWIGTGGGILCIR